MPINGTLQPRRLTPATLPNDPGPSLLETGRAAFALENSTAAGFQPGFRPDRDFDALAHLTDDELLGAPHLAGAQSLAELQQMRADLKQERANRRIIARAGWTGTAASIIAGVADPVALALGVPAGRAAVMAGRALIPAGAAVTSAPATLALGGAGGATLFTAEQAVQEGILQATQQERTATESAISLAAAALLGTGIGAGIQAGAIGLTGAALGGLVGTEAGSRSAREVLTDVIADVDRRAAAESTAGAARYMPLTPEDTELVSALGVEKVMGTKAAKNLVSPAARLMQSPSPTMREFVLRLAPIGFLTKGAQAGKRMPVAAQVTAQARIQSELVRQKRAMDLFYAGRSDRSMGRQDFMVEVSRANRNDDIHPDANIQNAARWMRENVYDLHARPAQQMGLLPEVLKPRGAKGYVPRDIDFRKIARDPAAFRYAVRHWLVGSGVDPNTAEDLAETLLDAVQKAPAGRLPEVKFKEGVPAPLRERTLSVPDEVLEPFLENNAEVLADRYTRTMITETEMARAAGGLPPQKALDETLNKINDDYRELIEAAQARGDAKEAARLEARRAEDLKGAQQLFARVRGTEGQGQDPSTFGNRAARTVGNVIPTQMLGTVTEASLTDLASIIFHHGLTRVAGRTLKNFAGGFKVLAKGGIARKELERAGVGLEVVEDHIRRTRFDDATIERGTGAVERFSQRLNTTFFRATLLAHWTDKMARYAGLNATQTILDSAEKVAKGGALSKADMQSLASAGLDAAMLKRIAAEAQHWQTDRGFRFGNADEWTDREAARALDAAVSHAANMALNVPGAADTPFWVTGPVLRLINQFMSFAQTQTNRIVLAGLQRRDAAMLSGWLSFLALGAAVTAVKDIVNKGELRDRSAAEWVAEAVDRSGLASTVFQFNNAAASFGLGFLPGTSRFAERDDLAARFLGPAVGQAERVRRLVLTARDLAMGKELTQGDVKNAIRLLPFQNLHIARQVLDRVLLNPLLEELPERREPSN